MISSHLLSKIDDQRIVTRTRGKQERERFRFRQVPALTKNGEVLISVAVSGAIPHCALGQRSIGVELL